ncbi:hypothetical protein F383_26300 [Gossypium arboreum]|uniref:EF-hand domain-containing protein n=1 Tax=Gossypium arboreum TaxID=29729 RepID=A0A0B0P4Q2_GOSAR|nr:hypothetical protein F383_26300 [Gossypium arboreum]
MNQDITVTPPSNSVHKPKLRPTLNSYFNKPTLFKAFFFCFLPFLVSLFLIAYLNQSGKNSEMVLLAGFCNDSDIANVDSSESKSFPFQETRTGHACSTMGEPCISCTTFNILAPIYKRLDQQEFWVGNEELVHMYEESLGAAGYDTFKLARTNNRGDDRYGGSYVLLSARLPPTWEKDGQTRLLTAIHKEYFKVLNRRELFFNDFGDRVAQLLHVQSVAPFSINQNESVQQEIIIVYQILQYLEAYQRENKLSLMPVILCGDWNGSKRGHVYKFLRSQGFVSSYDIAHEYTDSDADAHKWVSHRNHRGNICGVDFIWLRNPHKSQKLLKISWAEAAFGIIKYQLKKVSLAENDAFAFLRADSSGNHVTYSAFCNALRQVNLTGLSHGLSFQETKDLWVQADADGNGVVDYEEFKRIWDATWLQHMDEDCSLEDSNEGIAEDEAIGFAVKKAVLFPHEVEKGIWPENYSLSDHARLTAVFSPVRLRCSKQSL